jgi:hypothetical protein
MGAPGGGQRGSIRMAQMWTERKTLRPLPLRDASAPLTASKIIISLDKVA